jgi:hypothetical protein
MLPDQGVRQRGLIDRRIVFADTERAADYMFPFVDRRWRVPFVVLDLRMGPPYVLDGPLRVDRFRFRTPFRLSDLRRIESVSIEELANLVHYDPWWVFRRVSGVDQARLEALFATNVVPPFQHGGLTYRVRDFVFSGELDRLQEVQAKRGPFHPKSFRPGDIELLTLRSPPIGRPDALKTRAAKAL